MRISDWSSDVCSSDLMLFSEDRLVHKDASYGSIEVICGSMFSGKTEELIRRMRRAQLANLPVEIFKPAMDTRYHDTDRSEEHTSELQSLMRISYAVFCLKKKKTHHNKTPYSTHEKSNTN